MDLLKPAEASAAPALSERDQIADRFKWDLTKIYPDWNAWHAAYAELDRKIDEFAALRGTLDAAARSRCCAPLPCAMKSASSNTKSGISPRCATTRTSATTRSTPSGSRSRSSSPRRRRRRRGSIPNC